MGLFTAAVGVLGGLFTSNSQRKAKEREAQAIAHQRELQRQEARERREHEFRIAQLNASQSNKNLQKFMPFLVGGIGLVGVLLPVLISKK